MNETRRQNRASSGKRGRGVVAAVLVTLLVVGGGGAWFAWSKYETKIREVLDKRI
jgi:phosphoglycerate-specific signal transduction histidine kinase